MPNHLITYKPDSGCTPNVHEYPDTELESACACGQYRLERTESGQYRAVEQRSHE